LSRCFATRPIWEEAVILIWVVSCISHVRGTSTVVRRVPGTRRSISVSAEALTAIETDLL
jgi:hypothetical protein